MIYGIGTDICDIRRIRASLARHGERFAQRILSDGELATWTERSARWPDRGDSYLATRFSVAVLHLVHHPKNQLNLHQLKNLYSI